jgi:hypothetical protein
VRHFSCSRIVQQVSVDIDVAVLLYEGPCPPKAKVTSSNLVGRANQINELRRLFRRRAKGKLTTNSPTERAYWRVIGGHFVTLLP